MKDDTVIDEQLETLAAACDGEVVRQSLQPIVAEQLGTRTRIAEIRAEIVRQRLRRCVVRYHLRLEEGAGESRALRLMGKLFRPGDGPPIYAKMRQLWEQGFDREAPDGIRIPEALAFVPDLQLLVLEEVPGRSFKEQLVEAGSPELMRQVARVLVKLHGLRDWPGPLFRLERHVGRCHPAHPRLAEALPELADDIELILRRSRQREASLTDEDFGAIHGDLHLSQILIDSEDRYLIDLDSLARGDPASDLANFLVFLRSNRKLPELPRLEAVFLEEYFRVMDARIAERIPLYEAVTQLRRACKDLRFARPGWEERARSRIARGVACLEAH